MTRPLVLLLGALALVVGPGCATRLQGPDLGHIYDELAQTPDHERNPIVVIPGVLGSRLVDPDSGRIVWGAFAGDYAHPGRPSGASLLALPMREGAPLHALRDQNEAPEVLDRIRVTLVRLPVEQKAYFHLLGALGAGGYRDESFGRAGVIDYGSDHYTCFQFPYDWRRDVAENAARLQAFLLERRRFVEAEHERRFGHAPEQPIRFDLVAHSMGGLLVRYLLRYGAAPLPEDGSLPTPDFSGAALVDRAVLVATPNAGSLEAFDDLLDGASFSWVLPHFSPAILGTMPSLYQLMPRERHAAVVDAETGDPLSLFDVATWEAREMGLFDPRWEDDLAMLLPDRSPDERRAIARDHLRKSLAQAKRLHAALDVASPLPDDTELHLFAGDSEDTLAQVALDARGRVAAREFGPGDGKVLRTSAVMDERVGGAFRPGLETPIDWTRVTFLFNDHLGLTRDPAFTDNLLYLLLDSPRSGVMAPRDGGSASAIR